MSESSEVTRAHAERHRERTRREFARQAPSFELPGSIFRAEEIFAWICEHLDVKGSDAVLDVAGGTGQLGRRLAQRARFAVIADLTAEMLSAGSRAAAEQDARNVVFVEADATQLPFADAQFDLVVMRFALHHIDDPARATREMVRVCRAGGTVAIIDMACEPGPSGARQNELERVRDPSHARGLEERELVAVLADAGVPGRTIAERHQRMPAQGWVEQAKPEERERAQVLDALRDEANGGAPTGLHARAERDGDELTIEHRWVIVTGSPPQSGV